MKIDPKTGTDELVTEIEKLLIKTKLQNKSGYGSKLYYYGCDYNMGHQWVLHGMTPVSVEFVVNAIKQRGGNADAIEKELAIRKTALDRKRCKKMKLQESAIKKLTPAERVACDL